MEPVFICACKRSGTTMLGSMLGASPDAYTTPESQFKFDLLKNDNLTEDYFKNEIMSNFRFKLWNLNSEYIIKNFKKNKSGKFHLDNILNYYKRKFNINKYCWIDHTPNNILHISLLAKIYPKSKFIFLIRDGRAVMNSFFNVPWGCNTAYEAANEWSKYNSVGLAAKLKYKNRVKIVFYENIVADSVNELKNICNYLNIKYNNNMIKGEGTFLPKYTIKQHNEVGKQANEYNINKWKDKLRDKDIYIFEDQCGELLNLLGYKLTYIKYNKIIGDKSYSQIYSIIKRAIHDSFISMIRKAKINVNN